MANIMMSMLVKQIVAPLKEQLERLSHKEIRALLANCAQHVAERDMPSSLKLAVVRALYEGMQHPESVRSLVIELIDYLLSNKEEKK